MYKSYWKIGYYQKSSYQRSFVSGAILVYAPLLVLILVLPLFLSSESPETQSFILFNDFPGVAKSDTIGNNSSIPTGSQLSTSPASRRISNFVAGSRFEIIRESSSTNQPAVYSQVYSAEELIANFAVFGEYYPVESDEQGFADLDSDLQFGLPEGLPYLPMPPGVGMGVIYQDLPAIARLASPIWPNAARKSDTGVVQLLLRISKKGHISWDILDVTPGGFGFRRVVETALLKGRYYAAERDGRTVNTTILMTITICHNCTPEVTTSNNNVNASLISENSDS